MAKDLLHRQILKNMDSICDWYTSQSAKLPFPIYSSYDIRDAGFKVVNVDANIYPAGFNNICPSDKDSSVEHMDYYISAHYGAQFKNILLVTEEHTQNPFYWENALTIKKIIESTGRNVRFAFPRNLDQPLKLNSATGQEAIVFSGDAKDLTGDFKPDLIISNNDFSVSYEDWAKSIDIPINPPRELGWYQRKKSRYFKFYNELATQFCKISEIDPFLLRVETELMENFDIEDPESRNVLADKVDAVIKQLKKTYLERGIQQDPFVFVKNNSGTYGLAVIRVSSADEVRSWTYKSRKKMKAAKGGREVSDVIIQEGVPSVVEYEGAAAEPVIYMIGCRLAGGFLRTHSEKTSTESLNSPGAVYKRLCVSDLEVKPAGCPQENVYGWSAKLGLLAIAREAQEMNIPFKSYI